MTNELQFTDEAVEQIKELVNSPVFSVVRRQTEVRNWRNETQADWISNFMERMQAKHVEQADLDASGKPHTVESKVDELRQRVKLDAIEKQANLSLDEMKARLEKQLKAAREEASRADQGASGAWRYQDTSGLNMYMRQLRRANEEIEKLTEQLEQVNQAIEEREEAEQAIIESSMPLTKGMIAKKADEPGIMKELSEPEYFDEESSRDSLEDILSPMKTDKGFWKDLEHRDAVVKDEDMREFWSEEERDSAKEYLVEETQKFVEMKKDELEDLLKKKNEILTEVSRPTNWNQEFFLTLKPFFLKVGDVLDHMYMAADAFYEYARVSDGWVDDMREEVWLLSQSVEKTAGPEIVEWVQDHVPEELQSPEFHEYLEQKKIHEKRKERAEGFGIDEDREDIEYYEEFEPSGLIPEEAHTTEQAPSYYQPPPSYAAAPLTKHMVRVAKSKKKDLTSEESKWELQKFIEDHYSSHRGHADEPAVLYACRDKFGDDKVTENLKFIKKVIQESKDKFRTPDVGVVLPSPYQGQPMKADPQGDRFQPLFENIKNL